MHSDHGVSSAFNYQVWVEYLFIFCKFLLQKRFNTYYPKIGYRVGEVTCHYIVADFLTVKNVRREH